LIGLNIQHRIELSRAKIKLEISSAPKKNNIEKKKSIPIKRKIPEDKNG